MDSQKCRTCGEVKSFSDFWKQLDNRTGLQGECKICMKARRRRFYRRNAHAQMVSREKYRRANPVWLMVNNAKSRAKKRGMEFDLKVSDVVIPELCPVLGIKLIVRGKKSGVGHLCKDNSPSIDRVDNAKGYTRNNILIVSFKANRLKADASVEELRKVADFYEKRFSENSSVAGAGGMLPENLFRQSDLPMPGMQPQPKKQKSSVPLRPS